MEFNLVNILGIIGLLEVLYAYAMLSMKKWQSDTMAYQLLNINGSVFLAFNAWEHHAYPIFALNAIWAIIGLITVGRILMSNNETTS